MDPNIMKLLEEDEDETMHSGADVEAFTAALNRDIEGDMSSSQPSDSDSAVLSQGSNQLFQQWQASSAQDEKTSCQSQQELKNLQQKDQSLSGSNVDNLQLQIDSSKELGCLPLESKHSEDEQHAEQTSLQFSQSTGMLVSEKNSTQTSSVEQQKQPQDSFQQRHEEKNPLQYSHKTGVQISEKNPTPAREPDRMYNPENEPQNSKSQKMSNQLATPIDRASSPMNRSKQVPFALLLPVILPQLDKDRAMQLQTLYSKLKKNEIPKDGFVRHMRGIVGDQMLKLAVMKLQAQAARNSQSGPNQFQLQSQASVQQHNLKMSSSSTQQFTNPHSFTQLHQEGRTDPSYIPSSAVQAQTDSSYSAVENNAQKSREVDCLSDSHGMPVSQVPSSSSSAVNQERERAPIPIQGIGKQQQHLQFSQTSFSMYGSGGGSYHQYAGTNVNPPSSLKPQLHDSQMRSPLHQSSGPAQLGGTAQSLSMMNVPKFERQTSINDHKRLQGTSLSHLANNSTLPQNSTPWQPSTSAEPSSGTLSSMTYVKQEPVDHANEQSQKSQLSTSQGSSSFSASIPGTSGSLKSEPLEKQSSRVGFSASTSMVPASSASSSLATQLDHNVSLNSRIASTTSPGITARTLPKKPSIGQKKPLETPGSSPPLPSKKQKVSGAFSDQSIEQLNDVTAVSGVNLREEEEQLFSAPKEDSRVSEASRRVVQEEEDRLILQKTPLQKKLAKIMAKCGVMNISNDVERCLSLCVEERLRGLISNLIRLSKQRVDSEKPRHRTFITSDVKQQILLMNRKAREEWDKKQAEAGKLRKPNEPEGNAGGDGDKEKDEGRVKSHKSNKEEDDKMRTTAANVAARAAVGGDDMLSKWQLMAEQARQKRDGGMDAASGSQLTKDVNRKFLSSSGKNVRDNQEAERRGHSAALATSGTRKFGRNQTIMPQTGVARSISIKDVIAALEREPQMSKSLLIYRLYESVLTGAGADAVAE